MEFKTKYSINDVLYFMYDNKIVRDVVCGIRLECLRDDEVNNAIGVAYSLDGFEYRDKDYEWLDESELFATKEELIKSL